MRIKFFPFLILALLACSPLQTILDLGPNAPAARLQTPALPQTNSRVRALTPTRAAAQATFNGAPLALTATTRENIYTAQGVPGSFQQTIIANGDAVSRRLMSDLGWSGSPRVNVYVFPSRAAWLQGIAQIGGLSPNEVSFQANLQGDAWITRDSAPPRGGRPPRLDGTASSSAINPPRSSPALARRLGQGPG